MSRLGDNPVKPPAALSAEDAVLGAVFLKPDVLAWLDVQAADFFDPKNQVIWNAMTAVYANAGTVDAVLLEAELARRGVLEKIGGLARLSHLALFVPTADNADHYAAELVRKRIAREALLVGGRLRELVERGIEGDELLDAAHKELVGLNGRRQVAAIPLFDAAMAEFKALADDMQKGRRPGAPTGMKIIDGKIGGIPTGILSVLAARPSIGKSAFALAVCEAAARAGWLTVLYTFEDSVSGFAQRSLANHAEVETSRIRGREVDTSSEMSRLMTALDKIRVLKNVLLVRAHGMTIEQVVRSARVERQKRRAENLLVVVDYLQLVPASGQGMKKHERVAHTAEHLSEFAGADGAAVLALSQLNRESERENRAPRLSDLRDSGEIEQVGKLVLALHDPGKGDELSVFCLKNHQGPRAEFRVNFDRQFCRVRG